MKVCESWNPVIEPCVSRNGKNARVIDRCLEGGQIVFLIAGFRSPHHSYLKDSTEGNTLRSAVLLPEIAAT